MNSPTHYILLVDDNQNDLLQIQEELKNENYDILVARNNEEFKNCFQQGKINVIISEISLTNYNGFDALILVKEQKGTLPFIFLSRNISEETTRKLLSKGATDCIEKTGMAKLGFAVKRALRESELILENEKSKIFLRYHDEQLRQLLTNMNEGVVMTDRNSTIHFVNKKYCTLTGYKADELIGGSFKKIFFNSNFSSADQISNHEFQEKELARKDRKKIWVRISGVPIFDSHGNGGLIHILEDIQEQKNTEYELRKLSRAVDQSPESIVITDPQGNIEYANPVTFELTGYSKNELLGAHTRIFSSKQKSPEEYRELWETINWGKVWKGEFQNKKKNGEIYWESATISPVMNNNNEITHFLAIKEDITEQREMTRELIIAKERAEANDRLKSAFLANISHEIRTPLNGIFGFAELLRTPELTDDLKEKYIRIIEQSGQRMLNVMNDIVDISMIESGQIETHISETNLNKLLNDLESIFSAEAREKNLILALDKKWGGDDFLIFTDQDKLTRILTNLLKNALKFTATGSIKFGYSRFGNSLRFFVEDTGVGIPEQQTEFIFERFRQGSVSLTRAYEGVGLGLPISKAFVEMLGGTIWVESKVGVGSTFFFEITLKEKTKNKPGAFTTNTLPTAQKINILIVEDDRNSLVFMKTLLKLEGFSILEAYNGIMAIEIVKNHPEIDLVLIDMKMPEMDGFEATTHIKQLKPSLPVIAQTAYALREDIENAHKAGCDDYVHKPVKKQILLEKIKKLLPEK